MLDYFLFPNGEKLYCCWSVLSIRCVRTRGNEALLDIIYMHRTINEDFI